jgi:predicted nucleotide-binding protein
MENAKKQIEKLIEIGNNFTYSNFSAKSEYGYPESFTPEWVAWETRCNSVIEKLFGVESAQYKAIETAIDTATLGWGPSKFELKKNYILGILKDAIEVVENDLFNEIQNNKADAPINFSSKVFIVHGHDEISKTSLEIFLNEIGLQPVVLHREADEGQTIIEKFEKHSDVGYAFILLTPDECAYLASEANLPEVNRSIEFRARPNVIFEFGYFIGKLGRSRVCCLHKKPVNLPSDVNGIIYKGYNNSVEEVAYSIMKDLKAAGYKLK